MDIVRLYQSIIQNAKFSNRNKQSGIYYEEHHIKPRCMGGNDNKDNLILLTAKEHYICHKILCLIYPNNKKLFYAFRCMILMAKDYQNRYIPSASVYEEVKKKAAEFQSERMRGRIPVNKGVCGIPNPKVSIALKGKKPWNAGKTNVYRDESLIKMSVSAKNRNISESNEEARRAGISKNGRGNGYIRYKQILDTRDNKIYDSVGSFLITINMNRVKFKKLLDNKIICFYENKENTKNTN